MTHQRWCGAMAWVQSFGPTPIAYSLKDMNNLELVQHKFTKRLPGMKNFSYHH